MSYSEARLPPDIIRAIEKVTNSGGVARVKLDRGVWKVQQDTVKLVAAQEA